MSATCKSLVAAVALLAVAGAQASGNIWSVYSYAATLDATTTIGGTTFTAGAPVTGAVYVIQGNTPTNGGWGFANEVALYVDSVNQFSFSTAGLSAMGEGAGNAQVDNNRRLVSSGAPFQDVFQASLRPETTTRFYGSPLGGGATEVSFELRSPFLNPAPLANSSLALPSAVNLGLFSALNNLRLTFANGATLDATINTMTVSQVTQLPAVPEPSTAMLAVLGLATLGLMRRRQRAA